MELKLTPTDREIIRVLTGLKLRVTPAKIARTINVHPATVKKKLLVLDKANITVSMKRGNRTYTKLK